MMIKSFFDMIISILTVLLLSPLFLAITILLLLSGEHKVFYFQKRVGLKNKNFRIIKFATMIKNSQHFGSGSLTVRNDPRVTKIGKYLRKAKMNELPQLFNVIAGDMSFVGPRPQTEIDFLKFPIHVQQTIYNEKPGITGPGAIIFRDEERLFSTSGMEPGLYYQSVIAPYKGEVEIWYNRNRSLMTDLKLIFITGWVILFPKSNIIYRCFKTLPKREL